MAQLKKGTTMTCFLRKNLTLFGFVCIFLCCNIGCVQNKEDYKTYHLRTKDRLTPNIIKIITFHKGKYDSTVVIDKGYIKKNRYNYLSYRKKTGIYIKDNLNWVLAYSFQDVSLQDYQYLSFQAQNIPFQIGIIQYIGYKDFFIDREYIKVYKYEASASAHDYDYQFFTQNDGLLINYNPQADTFLEASDKELESLIKAIKADTTFFPKPSHQLRLDS